jgi:hypothetical protein
VKFRKTGYLTKVQHARQKVADLPDVCVRIRKAGNDRPALEVEQSCSRDGFLSKRL